jgi:hypothetical protein
LHEVLEKPEIEGGGSEGFFSLFQLTESELLLESSWNRSRKAESSKRE